MLSANDIKDLQYARQCIREGVINLKAIDKILEKVELNHASPSRKPLSKREKRMAHYESKIKV